MIRRDGRLEIRKGPDIWPWDQKSPSFLLTLASCPGTECRTVDIGAGRVLQLARALWGGQLAGAALRAFPSQAEARGTLGEEASRSWKLARRTWTSLIRGQKLGTEPALFVPQDVAGPRQPWGGASCCSCPGAAAVGSRGLRGLWVVVTEGGAEEGSPPQGLNLPGPFQDHLQRVPPCPAQNEVGGRDQPFQIPTWTNPAIVWIWDLNPKRLHTTLRSWQKCSIISKLTNSVWCKVALWIGQELY